MKLAMEIIITDLAESDLSYTHGLMTKGEESYEGKEILILGGGDGALLWELLKENPKFVTMIDVRSWRRFSLIIFLMSFLCYTVESNLNMQTCRIMSILQLMA